MRHGRSPPDPPILSGAALACCLAHARLLLRPAPEPPPPDPEKVATAALLSIRDQGRLVPFSARFVAMASASESHLGLTARKTLIMPGTVRYGVDLARLRRSSLAWDQATRTLTVTLPPIELSRPDIDLTRSRTFGSGC